MRFISVLATLALSACCCPKVQCTRVEAKSGSNSKPVDIAQPVQVKEKADPFWWLYVDRSKLNPKYDFSKLDD